MLLPTPRTAATKPPHSVTAAGVYEGPTLTGGPNVLPLSVLTRYMSSDQFWIQLTTTVLFSVATLFAQKVPGPASSWGVDQPAAETGTATNESTVKAVVAARTVRDRMPNLRVSQAPLR